MTGAIKPSPPRFIDPPIHTTLRNNTVTVRWTNTLGYATVASFYQLQSADNENFSGAKTYINYLSGDNPTERSITFSTGTWYLRVLACRVTYGEGSQEVINPSEWSSTWDFTVDPTAPIGDPEDFLAENKNKFVPIVYGQFSRNDASPDTSNGLALAYLGRFTPDPMYFIARHNIVTKDAMGNDLPIQLFVPSPGAENIVLEVPQEVDSDGDISGPTWAKCSSTRTALAWRPKNGKYIGTKTYPLSDASLSSPFHHSDWRAIDYKNVLDGNELTQATIKKHRDEKGSIDIMINGVHVVLTSVGDKWYTEGGAAWEIHDPEQSLPDVVGSSNPEIWVKYANLQKLYSIIDHGKTIGEDDDVGDEITFQICNYVDPANINNYASAKVGDFDGLKFNDKNWNSIGPLQKDQLPNSTNRNFAFFISVRAITDDSRRLGENLLRLGEAQIQIRESFAGKEYKKTLESYVGCLGKPYGSWVTNFNSRLGSHIVKRYSRNPTSTAIEDPAMIIASLLIDFGGLDVSNIDADTFTGAISVMQKMRINVTDEGTTIADVIKEICKQTPFSFVFTPSGKARLIPLRTTTTFWNDLDATITWGDIDPNKFSVQKTPLDKVVNVLSIKSRYHAETDRWVDYDEFENSASIAKYGRKKPKSPLEFKYINSGPYVRDGSGNSTAPMLYNSVKVQAVHLIEPDIQNGVSDDNHKVDDGWWSKQHNEISVYLPGYKFMNLEIGDLIKIDNESFAVRNVQCFGETWATKKFRIQSIEKNQDGVMIRSAVQTPQYDNICILRGLAGIYGT